MYICTLCYRLLQYAIGESNVRHYCKIPVHEIQEAYRDVLAVEPHPFPYH